MFWYESSSYTLIVLTEHFYLACTEVQLIYPVNAFHLELQTLLDPIEVNSYSNICLCHFLL